MTQTLASLKKNSGTSLDRLAGTVKKLSDNKRETDERFWTPEIDKAGNGFAIIRFLDAPKGEDAPFVRYWDHGFQGPGGWYIENSLTSIGEDDPLGEANQKLWATGTEANKQIVRERKRRLHYVSNILIVSDPSNKGREGKVYLYKYGKKIFDKLNDLMNPQFPTDVAVNPFDFWTGANFELKIRKVEGYRNYDKSEFEKPTQVAEQDADIEAIWDQCQPLKPFLDKVNYKSYAELEKRLNKVLGIDGPSRRETEENSAADEIERRPAAEPNVGRTAPAPREEAPAVSTEEDPDLAYFRDLAKKKDDDDEIPF